MDWTTWLKPTPRYSRSLYQRYTIALHFKGNFLHRMVHLYKPFFSKTHLLFSPSHLKQFSHVSSDVSIGAIDAADFEDGVPDYDLPNLAKQAELWNPLETGSNATSTELIAAELFREDDDLGSIPDYESYVGYAVLPYAEASDGDEPEPSIQTKVPKANKDSATSQNLAVIERLTEKIIERGGIFSADMCFIDFECAASLSAQCSLPCEVGITRCNLSLNNLLSKHEAGLVNTLHRLQDDERNTDMRDLELEREQEAIHEQLTALGTPQLDDHWFQRVMHPGVASEKTQLTGSVMMLECHGIPLEGITGAASSREELFSILERIESLIGVPSLRLAKHSEANRHFAPPSGNECKALLFGYNVAIERASLNSLCMRARDMDGLGPFRFTTPVYDAAHLLQSFHLLNFKASPDREEPFKLLSARCIEGLELWLQRPDIHLVCAAPCKYHAFLARRADKIMESGSIFHCALEDTMAFPERLRFVLSRYFPRLTEGVVFRHALPNEPWPTLPAKRGTTDAANTKRSLDDLSNLAGIEMKDITPKHWAGEGRADVFNAIQRSIAEGNVEAAGRLTLSWVQILSSNVFDEYLC